MTIEDQPRARCADSMPTGLKAEYLSYVDVLAQSVSVIAPSTVPAAVLGLIYASSGNGTWLSFLLGMAGLVIVSVNINEFARRSSSAGSLYSFVVRGMGPSSGVLSGWALLFGYMLTGVSTLCGFVATSHGLLGAVGLAIPDEGLASGAIAVAFALSARDVKLSSRTMLVLEGMAIAAVLALGVLVWKHNGFALDHEQLVLSGATPGGILAGVVLVVFGFSGFESSTSLGAEAKDPLRSIPRSIVQSVLFSGFIFVFMAYVVILGFRGHSENLATVENPLLLLSGEIGASWLGVIINIGILLSFFACTMGAINATARIVFSMARHGVAPGLLGAAHEKTETPRYALGLAALLTLVLAIVPWLSGISPYQSQGYFGTLCSFGFLTAYIMISISAPVYLRRIGELKVRSIVFGALGAGLMVIPFVGVIGIPGSALFPPPEYPNNMLVWGYLAYMLAGAGWLLVLRKYYPKTIVNVINANGGAKTEPVTSPSAI
jgi:amino acid transporter